MDNNWKIFTGSGEPHDRIKNLPPPPNWRSFGEVPDDLIEKVNQRWDDFCENNGQKDNENKPTKEEKKGKVFQIENDDVVSMVNAALYLRRPLMVTGKPGTGKTSLAYAIAYELKLGPVLLWPITARSTLQEGLFLYDAIARLQNAQLQEKKDILQLKREIAQLQNPSFSAANPEENLSKNPSQHQDIGSYITLGPVGTAFLPYKKPRVLLIDEIDKSDINLPNDLLNLFEEGEFKIPELVRLAKEVEEVEIRTEDGIEVPVRSGRVCCKEFPLIIMTNNGDRVFPPAFLRRCLRLNMPSPTPETLGRIVKAHLGQDIFRDNKADIETLIEKFRNRSESERGNLATDQLLNAIYMVTGESKPNSKERERLDELLMKYLDSSEDGED